MKTIRLADLEAEVREVPDPSKTARRAARLVFTVRMGVATGSGFAIRKRGGRTLIVTSFHVIADGFVRGLREVEVTRDDLTYAGTVIDVSEDDDLAVISVEKKLPTISLLEQRPRIGEPVLVLGSPTVSAAPSPPASFRRSTRSSTPAT
jgi:putative serine protease PepD